MPAMLFVGVAKSYCGQGPLLQLLRLSASSRRRQYECSSTLTREGVALCGPRPGPTTDPVENQESSPVIAHLVLRAGSGTSADQIASLVVAAWQEIDDSLAPVLGQGGVAALYGRSLYLTSSSHACLSGATAGVGTTMDLANLKSVLAQQNSADAATAGGALLHNFHALLTSLVGPTLTERLLRSAWENLLGGRPAQDKDP